MRSLLGRWAHILIPSAILMAAVGVKGWQFNFAEDMQNLVFDEFQRLKPRPYQAAPVRIVDIDDESLSRLGQWPWPRVLVARLVDRLRRFGAKAIVFDVVFAEPDRTSPSVVVRSWPQTPELQELLSRAERLPDHDRVFARAISGAPVVAGYVLTREPNKGRPASKASLSVDAAKTLPWLGADRFLGALTNLPLIEKAAQGNGNFSFEPERDGVIRRVPLLFGLGDEVLPSLSLEALRVAMGADRCVVKTVPGAGVESIRLANSRDRRAFSIPTDESGRILLYDSGPQAARSVPAWKVLNVRLGPELAGLVRGNIVYIGTSAPGLMDLRSTPLQRAAAGVGVHAQVAEQVILKKFLYRPEGIIGAEALFMFLSGAVLVFLLPRVGALWCGALGLGAAAAAFAASWFAFSIFGYLTDPVIPSAALMLVYLSSSLISYIRSEAQRRQIRGAFSRYMSPVLVEQLARHPEKLVLGGELREMTLLFTDIRGFTAISERFASNPHGLTQLINRFLTPMTGIILDHQGTIDKYMGDCIIAFWNAPLDDPEHPRNACRAALDMRARLAELNRQWEASIKAEGGTFVPIRAGIGINTGRCCVGNMGSEQRFDYSVLGDDVNLASRLEGQSKTYGVDIVIGENTRRGAEDFACLELDLIRVKGKTKPARIYALLGGASLKSADSFDGLEKAHREMLEAYRAQEWQDAAKRVHRCAELACALDGGGSLEGLYRLYAERIKTYEAGPPGPRWDGVFVAASK